MSGDECIHGDRAADCAMCSRGSRASRATDADRTGHEKLLVFCPAITADSLLHLNRQGESYRLRAYVGRLAGKREWTQPDAPTTSDFLRIYSPQHRIDVAGEQLSVEKADRWAAMITTHNRRLAIGE